MMLARERKGNGGDLRVSFGVDLAKQLQLLLHQSVMCVAMQKLLWPGCRPLLHTRSCQRAC